MSSYFYVHNKLSIIVLQICPFSSITSCYNICILKILYITLNTRHKVKPWTNVGFKSQNPHKYFEYIIKYGFTDLSKQINLKFCAINSYAFENSFNKQKHFFLKYLKTKKNMLKNKYEQVLSQNLYKSYRTMAAITKTITNKTTMMLSGVIIQSRHRHTVITVPWGFDLDGVSSDDLAGVSSDEEDEVSFDRARFLERKYLFWAASIFNIEQRN